MTSKLRFGIVGCGRFASSFSGYLLKVADIVALCNCNLNAENTPGGR
jgi:predicted dehydrogenase